MTEADRTQPEPGYRPGELDPAEVLVRGRCGALVSQSDTGLHDQFHVSVERPATLPSTMTRR